MVETEDHLRVVLAQHWVDNSIHSPVRAVRATLDPSLRKWGGNYTLDIRRVALSRKRFSERTA